MLDQERDSEKTKRRLLRRMRNAPRRRAGGRITWTREELHERVPDLK